MARHYDSAKGLYYWDLPGGGIVYDSPNTVAGGNYVTPSGQQWNQQTGQWEAKTSPAETALDIGIGGLLTAGVAAVAGGIPFFGGSASASAAPAAATSSAAGGGMSIPWGTLISAGSDIFGRIFGAETAASASDKAAEISAKAAADALAFEKEQAALAQSNFIAAQNASYGQQVYQYQNRRPYQGLGLNAANTLGQMLGLPAINTDLPDIPPPPVFQTAPPSGSGSPTGAPSPALAGSAGTGGGDPILSGLTGIYSGLGVSPTGPGSGPTDIAYYAQKVAQTGGWTPQNAAYWKDRIASDLAKARSGGSGAQTIGNYLGAPMAPRPLGTGVDATTLMMGMP